MEEGECQVMGLLPPNLHFQKTHAKKRKMPFCFSQARRWGGDDGRWRGRGGGDCFNSI